MGFENQKPVICMVLLQLVYAGITLFTRASLLQGMSPRIFVVYRQALATILIAPLAYFKSRRGSTCTLGWKNFSLIVLITLIGITINQNVYFEGLYLASSSMASAMGNLLPAITFIIAYLVGLEKINIKSLRSIAKITGTIICVTGAVGMVLVKGPKILNKEFHHSIHMLFTNSSSKGGETWLIGCLFLFASNCCWSIWLILQVPVSKSYPDHLSLAAWMCFMATWQSAVVAFFVEKDLESWKLHTNLELGSIVFTAAGSATSLFAQSWCISKRGPLFSAMFTPLGTVLVTLLACTFIHEEMYLGSFIGSIAVIFGLYVVLWGKAEDQVEIDADKEQNINPTILNDESSDKTCCRIDLEEPLLSNKIIVTDLKDDKKN